MKALLQFIRQDGRRFAWEMGLAMLVSAVGWAVGYFLNQRSLQTCQDERVELLRQVRADEAFRLSIEYGQKLKEKDLLLLDKANEILELRKKMALDSADRLSLVEAMRAINQRYKSRN
ncbi:hypothetical protein GCM10028803_05230 [Larkinella knui]|uniref:Uncharacterized protein n=1 Tax=Larkinella knui TaxID=2025310 RepID=A0A3P1CKL4_9BACT|nr:hypothetical protein [Larkinella knui]RRB13799.1 hypothetical protein EHT87_16200 [Larkinella knui]